MSSPPPPAGNRLPTDPPSPPGRGRRSLDRQDRRWLLLALVALALGAGLMVLRGRLLQTSGSGGGAATAPADPNRPMSKSR